MNMNKIKYPKKIKEGVFLVWKELGETPLQALERLRNIKTEEKNADILLQTKMTYAGRLDPLAEGELLILVGEECKKKDEYLGLDKVYEVEILLGAQTDTGDVMGMTIDNDELKAGSEKLSVKNIEKVLKSFLGKVSWSYPAFSSKTVNGKPLFLWALEGKINEVEIPTRESEIYQLELLGSDDNCFTQLRASELRDLIHAKISSVKKVPENIVNGKDTKRLGADFRRADVLQSWAEFFLCPECRSGHKFEVLKLRCKCSSGTYMRTLAQKIGEDLGTPALALSIVRTEIVL
jgi:tRNA pseudouridine(55) synthase